jgi:hypothetical protein
MVRRAEQQIRPVGPMNDHSAGYAELPRTAYLDHTLRRARTAAEQRSHRYVTLEHFLLALLDDPDALRLLQTLGADTAAIHVAIADAVNNRMSALSDPSAHLPSFSHRFDSLFPDATQDAIRAGRRQVDGALALIAVAKDPGSNASAILTANGFHVEAALQAIGAGPPPPNSAPQPVPASPPAAAAAAQLEPDPASGANFMEDMLTSVRNILDDEERKERGHPPAGLPLPPMQAGAPRGAQPRQEPQMQAAPADRQRSTTEPRGQPPYRAQEAFHPGQRPDPQLRPAVSGPERIPEGPQQAGGFSEPPAPGFDYSPPPAPQPSGSRSKGPGRKSVRGRSEAPALLTKILEGVPRKGRVARGVPVQIRLTKEEAAQLLARAQRRGQPRQGSETLPLCRAVTVRLLAPEGGFSIEAAAPETQWILDRPSFLGEEAFGTWAWTAIPLQRGAQVLSVSISARDVDGSGFLSDLQLPEQAIKVRVKADFAGALQRLLRSALLLFAGSALALAAPFVLKIIHRFVH